MRNFPRRILSLGLLCLLVGWVGNRLWTQHQRSGLLAREYEPPPEGMVLVPAGEFLMGSDDPDAEPDERPLRKSFLPAFYIDRLEVTNRRYREFDREHRYPAGEEELPVTFIFKRDAEAFCRWAGRRLPTNSEWEKAARGADGRIFPWGSEFDSNRANLSRGSGYVPEPGCKSPRAPSARHGKRPVGSFPGGSSPYGCQDMAGNVWEWVSDTWFDKDVFGRRLGSQGRGIIRGGAHGYSRLQGRTSYQGFEDVETTCHDVGFRCAMDAVPKGG